jgi:hypothetical protein
LPGNIQKHLEDLAAVIKADPEISKDVPDSLGLMKSVFDRLDKEPAKSSTHMIIENAVHSDPLFLASRRSEMECWSF